MKGHGRSMLPVMIAVMLWPTARASNRTQDRSTPPALRYKAEQHLHPFPLGAMSYDMASLPYWYQDARPGLVLGPDMAPLRAAGLNLLDDVSMSTQDTCGTPGSALRRGHASST